MMTLTIQLIMQLRQILSMAEQIEHNNDSVHDSSSNTEDEKLEDDNKQIVENEDVSSSIKSSIIPGSKPFNVVMTPSDKNV